MTILSRLSNKFLIYSSFLLLHPRLVRFPFSFFFFSFKRNFIYIGIFSLRDYPIFYVIQRSTVFTYAIPSFNLLSPLLFLSLSLSLIFFFKHITQHRLAFSLSTVTLLCQSILISSLFALLIYTFYLYSFSQIWDKAGGLKAGHRAMVNNNWIKIRKKKKNSNSK